VNVTVNPVLDSNEESPTDYEPIFDDSDTAENDDHEPAEDPFAEEIPVVPIEELPTPEDSAETDDSFDLPKYSEEDQTTEILYLTDEISTDGRSEHHEDDRSYIYFDNNLYRELATGNHFEFDNKTAVNAPIELSLEDFNMLEFNRDDTSQAGVDEDYDVLRHEIDEYFNTEQESQAVKAKIVTVTAASFTVGIVSYLLRAGSLFASLVSSLPLWRGFDPIAIFSRDKKKQESRNEIPNADELKSETFFDDEGE